MASINFPLAAELMQTRVPPKSGCLRNITLVENEGRVLRLRPDVGVGSDSYVFTIQAEHSRAGLVATEGVIRADEFRGAELREPWNRFSFTQWVAQKIEASIAELLRRYPCGSIND